MITRIFRATVPNKLHKEFEQKFVNFSVPLVKEHSGLISISIAGPSRWNNDEFLMITVWNSEESIEAFAGENWNEAFIPNEMEKYFTSVSLDHFTNIEI